MLEGARDLHVGRFVYASSNHAVGFTPRASMVSIGGRVWPDPFYGFGKAAAEALCSLYHDRHGLAVACLRIGSFREPPTTRRELSTWLSVGDAIRLVDDWLRTSDLGFAIVYGISNNTRAWWDLAPGRARPVVTSWEQQITDRHEGGLMNVKLQWYPVTDGQVDLPLGAQIIEVRFENTLGMGGGEQPVAVLVQVNEMPSE